MQVGLEERDWDLLLKRIATGKCTPVLGPDVCSGMLPSYNDIASSWAYKYDYPLTDSTDLARVSQFLAVQYDPFYPKEKIQNLLANTDAPDFNLQEQPYAVLSTLNLPIYITTNYDDFMLLALKSQKKEPELEICRWNDQLRSRIFSILETGYIPSPANPLVFHLYGTYKIPGSLVLTEDDYLDFLINVSSGSYPLHPLVQRALTGTSLILIGFRTIDWDFRVLFKGLVAATDSSLRRISVTVQLPPVPNDSPVVVQEKVRRYLDVYLDSTDRRMRVYWGTAQEFLSELRRRWQSIEREESLSTFSQGKPPPVNLMRLLSGLMASFNKSELETIAFELHIDYENLPSAKEGFARELIVYLQRRKRISDLLEIVRRDRPDLSW